MSGNMKLKRCCAVHRLNTNPYLASTCWYACRVGSTSHTWRCVCGGRTHGPPVLTYNSHYRFKIPQTVLLWRLLGHTLVSVWIHVNANKLLTIPNRPHIITEFPGENMKCKNLVSAVGHWCVSPVQATFTATTSDRDKTTLKLLPQNTAY